MASRAFRWLPALLLPFAAVVAHAQTADRLVEEVGVSEQRGYVAVTVLFGCSLRYVSHTPASSGDRVSVRLSPQPDCGSPVGGSIVPPALDGHGVIRSIEMSRALGTDLELRIGWSRPEQFVLVPSFDGRGLRIRLIRAEEDRSKVSVREVTGGTSTYAVNLDAAKTRFEAEAIAAAAEVDGCPHVRLRDRDRRGEAGIGCARGRSCPSRMPVGCWRRLAPSTRRPGSPSATMRRSTRSARRMPSRASRRRGRVATRR